jgi:hypothetical protein
MYSYVPVTDESLEEAVQIILEEQRKAGRPIDSLLWAEALSIASTRIREAIADREMATIQLGDSIDASNN